jgi:hypothetical protein
MINCFLRTAKDTFSTYTLSIAFSQDYILLKSPFFINHIKILIFNGSYFPHIFFKKDSMPVHNIGIHRLHQKEPVAMRCHLNLSGPSLRCTFINLDTSCIQASNFSPTRALLNLMFNGVWFNTLATNKFLVLTILYRVGYRIAKWTVAKPNIFPKTCS